MAESPTQVQQSNGPNVMALAAERKAQRGYFGETRDNMGDRIIDAWRDMRASTRRLIDEDPDEHRLLFYVVLSDIIFFLSWSLKTVVSPVTGVDHMVPLEIGALLIGALMCRTAAMYIFSSVLTTGSRLFGGKGDWKATRCGVFWGALVAAPFGFLMAVLTVMLSWLEPIFPVLSQDWVALPPYWISLVPFIWFISQGLAESQGFQKNSIPFMVMSTLALAGLVGAIYLGSIGVL
ncbi:MAG: Yip1 family protein [Pseudomonadota bacterium]